VPGTLITVQRAVFVAHQRVEFITVTRFVSTAVNISVSLLLLINGFGVVSLVVAFVIEQYVIMFCYFVLIRRFIAPLHWEFEFTYLPALIREIKTFAALSVLAGVFARPEVIILSILQDETEVGYYSAALRLVVFWHTIPQVYMTNVFPVLSRSHRSAQNRFQLLQDKSIKYLLVISFPLAVGILVTAAPTIKLFYGSGFDPSIRVLQILAWLIPLNALMSVFWRVLAARNQQRLDLRARTYTIVFRLGVGCLLILVLASLGAAIVASASLLLNTLLLMRYVKQDGSKLHIFHLGWRSGLAAIGMGAAIWTLSGSLQFWFLIPLAAAIYVALVFLLRIFSTDDLAIFRQIWNPEMVRRS
jgi:O-antigen/teichoic acid export membrane protein